METASAHASGEPLLQMLGICKRFGPVQALADVSFNVRPGAVHALCGENGAGKSTLMKVLAGVHHPDAGEILWEGTRLHLHGPADADKQGISIIHQELNLIPHLTVAENVLLNREPTNRFGLMAWG